VDFETVNPRMPSPVVELSDDRLGPVRLWIKRDDLIHPLLPGNKWRKLVPNLTAAARQGHRTLLTFGGAYSNHLRAVAAAGRLLGFDTIGVVRGEEHLPLNPSLRQAVSDGMLLRYLDRAGYRRKHEPAFLRALCREFDDPYLIPEGGSNAEAVRGCAELGAEIGAQLSVDVVCCAVGTGGTLAGLAAGLPGGVRALGVSALKGQGFLDADVNRLQHEAFGESRGDWRIDYEFHFGGFAKQPPALHEFIVDFYARHGILLERVYVAKLMAAVFAMVSRGDFAPGTGVLAVITGAPFPQ
jgi:1-aminocyclopropane-1-carboxylate deaminase